MTPISSAGISGTQDLDRETLRALARRTSGPPVLSVYARTDPRDPSNTNHMPAWEIELRNGLAAIEKDLEAGAGHEERKQFRDLGPRVERELVAMKASDRARSVAWFLSPENGESNLFRLQLPVRRSHVVWDSRPYVSPLVDVVDRGTATGLVAVGGAYVRLLHFEMGHVTEPESSTYVMDLQDWKEYQAYTAPNPVRGQQTVTHIEHLESRIEEQRGQFFDTAAKATSNRLSELGWERVAIVAEPQVASRFSDSLPDDLARRVVARLEFNIGHEEPDQIASSVEPKLEDVWRDRVTAGIAEACDRAAAGGPAAVGPQEVLGALGEARVEHLYIDAEVDFTEFAAAVPDSVGGPPAMIAERAVEAAIDANAAVSAISRRSCPRLDRAGGMVALLRY